MALKRKLQEVMEKMPSRGHANAWVAFSSKEPRNKWTGKDVNGRIMQNVRMYMRLKGFHVYGYKLKQLKACLNVYRGRDGLAEIELKTGFRTMKDVLPIDEYISPL
jgi:hypothetical protein